LKTGASPKRSLPLKLAVFQGFANDFGASNDLSQLSKVSIKKAEFVVLWVGNFGVE